MDCFLPLNSCVGSFGRRAKAMSSSKKRSSNPYSGRGLERLAMACADFEARKARVRAAMADPLAEKPAMTANPKSDPNPNPNPNKPNPNPNPVQNCTQKARDGRSSCKMKVGSSSSKKPPDSSPSKNPNSSASASASPSPTSASSASSASDSASSASSASSAASASHDTGNRSNAAHQQQQQQYHHQHQHQHHQSPEASEDSSHNRSSVKDQENTLGAIGLGLSLGCLLFTGFYPIAVLCVVCWWYALPTLRNAIGYKPVVHRSAPIKVKRAAMATASKEMTMIQP